MKKIYSSEPHVIVDWLAVNNVTMQTVQQTLITIILQKYSHYFQWMPAGVDHKVSDAVNDYLSPLCYEMLKYMDDGIMQDVDVLHDIEKELKTAFKYDNEFLLSVTAGIEKDNIMYVSFLPEVLMCKLSLQWLATPDEKKCYISGTPVQKWITNISGDAPIIFVTRDYILLRYEGVLQRYSIDYYKQCLSD